jgi:hypothetical protein
MIRIEVSQGENKVESVYIDKNSLDVISVIINYEKRWVDWTTGSGSGGPHDERYESFYIYDEEHPDDTWQNHSHPTEVKLIHDGELDRMYQKTSQEKDQLHVLYMPYAIVDDGDMLASWESEETQHRQQAFEEDLFNV